MILPLRTDSPLRTTPYMNWAIIVVNVLAYIAQAARPELTMRYQLYPHDPWLPAFFTYAFLHGGVLHIVGNMLFLYIFGNNVNDRLGHVGYLAFYLAGGVFAGVGFVVMQHGTLGVVGASGAVAAVVGAFLVLFPQSSITVVYAFILIGMIEIPSYWFILFFFVQDLIGLGAPNSVVAHSAHVSGTVFGFALSLSLLGLALLPRDQFDVLALVQRWNKRRQYRDMVSKGYNPFAFGPEGRGDPRAGPPAPPDAKSEKVTDLRAGIAEAIAHHDLPEAARLYLELRALDPAQVLSRQAQLDVANQLSSQQLYSHAADAYELFIKHYPKFEQIEQVELMLGLIYARYLFRYEQARECLLKAMARLHGERETAMARSELARIEPLLAANPQRSA